MGAIGLGVIKEVVSVIDLVVSQVLEGWHAVNHAGGQYDSMRWHQPGIWCFESAVG